MCWFVIEHYKKVCIIERELIEGEDNNDGT